MIIRRSLAVLGSILLLLPMAAMWQHWAVPGSLRWLAAVLFVVSLVSPLAGLFGAMASLPLATPWQLFSGGNLPSGAEAAEIMLLPFLSGACLRLAFDKTSVRSRLGAPALVLGAAILTSGVVRMFLVQMVSAFPDDFARDVWSHLTLNYFTDPQRYVALHSMTQWIEVLVLAVTSERILRRHPSAARASVAMLMVGGVETSALVVNRFFQVVARNGGTLAAAWNLIVTRPRTNPQWSDINAAGSYYALVTTPAIWMAIRRRWWAFATLPPLLLGLWFTGSRSALASVVIALLIAWTLSRPKVSWPRVVAVVCIAIVLATYAAWKGTDFQMPAESAIAYRQEFASIALRMARDHPWFGVGLAEFKHATSPYLRADGLESIAPFGGQNAHNNFLQILGELGVTGFFAFMWLLARPAADLWHAARARATTLAMIALAGGVTAFLLSSLGGHPFLTPQVQIAFFLMFGVFAGVTPARAASVRGARAARWIAAILFSFLIVSLPFRLVEPRRTLTLPNFFFGASPLHDSIDGLVYRLADRRSAWFVLSTVNSVDIPLRWTAESSSACGVDVSVDGRVVNHISPRADVWVHTIFDMSNVATRNTTRRFELEVQGSGCSLMVAPLVTHQ